MISLQIRESENKNNNIDEHKNQVHTDNSNLVMEIARDLKTDTEKRKKMESRGKILSKKNKEARLDAVSTWSLSGCDKLN